MVNAKIHIICGNCGSKDLEYKKSFIDLDSMFCNNCGTVHSLYDETWKK